MKLAMQKKHTKILGENGKNKKLRKIWGVVLVYRFNCSQCQATYIGEISRHLHTIMSEHRGISSHTLLQVLKPKDSRIRDHS